MKFKKRPVIVEASQWFNHDDHPAVRPLNKHQGAIDTLEGLHVVNKGDWIIQGIAGEFYPCKPDIFLATYEEVK